MKKFMMLAAAMLVAFSSCTDAPLDEEKADSIELSAKDATFTKDAGKAKVIVTSSADWKLTSKEAYDWATPSAFEGADGDIVTFEVAENTDEDRQAVYTFTCGKATADFTIISIAGEKPSVKVLSDAAVELSYEAGEFEVKVTSPIAYRKLNITLSDGADAWLTRKATLPGDADTEASIKFEVAALEGLDAREAIITIGGEFEGKALIPATVTVKQLAKEVLATETAFFKSELAGGEVVVPLISNVEYKIEIAAEGEGWLTYDKKGDLGEIFKVAALESGSRSANVTFTQTNAKEGVEALVAQITISQVGTLITWAADMTDARLFPKWDGDYQPATLYDQFTLEMLFMADNFDRPAGGIYTLMGVEGQFLLRFGDVGNPVDEIQIAMNGKNHNTGVKFEPKVWYHLAVTYNAGKITLYVDGEEKFSGDDWYRNSVNIFPSWSYEPSGNRTFWYGYSYDPNRDFNGYMTELRAWSKALTPEELNAPNHFYTVPEDSEFLMAYWKFTEGEGATVANKATNKNHALTGNNLYGETTITSHSDGWNTENYGDAAINWVSVALPNK